jgi:hypothetical protein
LGGRLALEFEFDSSAEASFAFRELLERSVVTGPALLVLVLRGPPEPGVTFSGVGLTMLATTGFAAVDVDVDVAAGSLPSDAPEARYGLRGRDPTIGSWVVDKAFDGSLSCAAATLACPVPVPVSWVAPVWLSVCPETTAGATALTGTSSWPPGD